MALRAKRENARCTRCGAESAWIEGTPKGTPPCDCTETIAENERLRAELEAAKAALATEREACDEFRRNHGRVGYLACAVYSYGDHRCPKCVAHDARRAAEAKGAT